MSLPRDRDRMLRAVYAPLALVVACALTACGGGDGEPAPLPAETCAPVTGESGKTAPGTLAAGTSTGGTFVPFMEGDPLVIIDGFQGGTWIMPAATLHGTSLRGLVNGSVTLSTGEVVGSIEDVPMLFEEMADGSGQLEYVAIPIGHKADQLPASVLTGRTAILRLELVDGCGGTAEGSVGVVLVYEQSL